MAQRINSHTPSQVAKMFGVETSTVYAWLSRREMQGVKIGHRRYISDQQVKEFILRRRTGDVVDHTYAYGPVKS